MAVKTKFAYIARQTDGREVRSTIEAETKAEAIAKLRGQRLDPVRVDPEKLANIGGGMFGKRRKASQAELSIFTRQLSTMISAGIPLLEAFEILADQTKDQNKGMAAGLQEVADLVRGGTELSEALNRFPKIFPEIYVNMVKAGEASGQLDVILNRVADFMERSESLKREIKSAMTYPVISLFLIFGISAFLMVYIIPKFKQMFDSLGATLPALTRYVVAVSDWLTTSPNYWFLIIGILGIPIAYKIAMRSPEAQRFKDLVFLKLPIFGPLSQKVTLSRFARTLGTLLASGVPLLQALEIVAKTSGNRIIEDVVLETRDTVKRGESLTSHLQTSWVFPPMVVKMMAIGERSGALETLLMKISDFYDEQIHAMVKTLTSLIEPIMLVIMGSIVGTVVIAIFLPILELQKQLQK